VVATTYSKDGVKVADQEGRNVVEQLHLLEHGGLGDARERQRIVLASDLAQERRTKDDGEVLDVHAVVLGVCNHLMEEAT